MRGFVAKFLEIVERFMGKRFAANVAKMMSGTVVAMAINFLMTPIITRLYTPDDIGTFTTITAIVGLFSGIAALRFDMALVLPEEENDAINGLALAGFSLVATTIAITLSVVLFGDFVVGHYEHIPKLASWLWTVPLFFFLTGLFGICRFWCTRAKMFGTISVAAVVASLTSNGGKVGMGSAGLALPGLVVGQVVGQCVATFGFAVATLVNVRGKLGVVSRSKMRDVAGTYRDFPLFHAPATFIYAAAKNLPNVGLGLFFSAQVVGWYSMAFLVLNLPVYVVSDAIRQVFYQRASEAYRRGENLRRDTFRLVAALFGIGLFPAILFTLGAKTILMFVLGSQWEQSGHYAALMTPLLFSLLVSVPSVTVLPVINKQRVLLVWHVASLAVSVAAIVVGGMLNEPTTTILLFSLSGTILNAILLVYVYWVLGKTCSEGSSDETES